MQREKVQELVYNMAKPVVEKKGLEIVNVEYVKEGANWYLRIYIDKDSGVDHDDCQYVSRVISDMLDEKDPIPQSYFLEVSSPGVERILQTDKDFMKFRDRRVVVHTYIPVEGKKVLEGTLGQVNEEILKIILENDSIIDIPRKAIAQVRLAWEEKGGE